MKIGAERYRIHIFFVDTTRYEKREFEFDRNNYLNIFRLIEKQKLPVSTRMHPLLEVDTIYGWTAVKELDEKISYKEIKNDFLVFYGELK